MIMLCGACGDGICDWLACTWPEVCNCAGPHPDDGAESEGEDTSSGSAPSTIGKEDR